MVINNRHADQNRLTTLVVHRNKKEPVNGYVMIHRNFQDFFRKREYGPLENTNGKDITWRNHIVQNTNNVFVLKPAGTDISTRVNKDLYSILQTNEEPIVDFNFKSYVNFTVRRPTEKKRKLSSSYIQSYISTTRIFRIAAKFTCYICILWALKPESSLTTLLISNMIKCISTLEDTITPTMTTIGTGRVPRIHIKWFKTRTIVATIRYTEP